MSLEQTLRDTLLCVCVCERERERGKERGSERVCECDKETEKETLSHGSYNGWLDGHGHRRTHKWITGERVADSTVCSPAGVRNTETEGIAI